MTRLNQERIGKQHFSLILQLFFLNNKEPLNRVLFFAPNLK